MARTKAQRADEDALDPVEAADVEHADDPDDGLLELDPEAVEAADEDDEDDDVEDVDDTDDLELDVDGSDDADEPAPLGAVDEDDDPVSVVALPDAAFDDDDDQVAAVIVDEDDDGEEIEGVRDGEFVCRRCFMALRTTQLADADRLLCRDCA